MDWSDASCTVDTATSSASHIERQDSGHSGGRWQFPCYRWLDPDKDDLCPYRTLVPRDPVPFADGDAAQRGALPRYLIIRSNKVPR